MLVQVATVQTLPVLEATACCAPLVHEPLGAEAAGLATVLKVGADPARLRLLSLVAAHEGAERSVYVAASARGRGVGRALLAELVLQSEALGLWTLQASVFPENTAGLRLHASCGFRVVGTRERIGQSNGVWRDTVVLERRAAD